MASEEKMKALDAALAQIEKQYGKGSVMKLGDQSANMGIDVVPTGSLSLDLALGPVPGSSRSSYPKLLHCPRHFVAGCRICRCRPPDP
jgi:hypothetical protein